jgi:cobalt/nickel transport system permease protein
MLLHIGALHLDVDSKQSTIWHSLAAHTRLLCTLIFVFAITLTPNGHWLTWGIYGLTLLSLILISKVTLTVLLKRVAVESAFIFVVLLGTLFRDGGRVIWAWGPFQITTVGLTILGSVTLKALLSLLILNVLTLTTSIPALLNALLVLRTPPLLVAILASMYRYINVLIGEFNAMRRAALSRNLMSSNHWQRLVVGNMIGSLFIRTYGRGELVYQAMLARGYQGIPVRENVPKGGRRDVIALTVTMILSLLGQAVYLI